MSTVEKLLVQIFERKKRIVDHVKEQILLFDRSLVSKCIIDGFDPPPWLLSPGPSELNKEDLISKLLSQPQSATTYPSTSYSLYQQPAFRSENVQHTGVHYLNKDFDKGNGLSALHQCPSDNVGGDLEDGQSVLYQLPSENAGCAPKSKSELDPGVTSPQECRGQIVSDTFPDPAPSLAKIQRSRSRQRALEVRNSAKATKTRFYDDKNVGSCEDQNTKSQIATLQSNHLDELVLVNSVDRNSLSFAVEKEKVYQCQSNERCENIYSGRITRSRSSCQPPKIVNVSSISGKTSFHAKANADSPTESMNKSVHHANVDDLLSMVKPTAASDESCEVREAKERSYRSEEKKSSCFCKGRLTRSKIRSQQYDHVKECPELDRYCETCKGDEVQKSTNSVKPFDISGDSCRITMSGWQMQATAEQQHNSRNAASGNTYSVRECEVSHPRSAAPSKSPVPKSLNRSGRVDLHEVSVTKVNVPPCTNGSDIVDLDRYDVTVADDLGSHELLVADSGSSASNSAGSTRPPIGKSSKKLGVGLDVAVSSRCSGSPMIVNPKLLDFDEVGDWCVKETLNPALEQQKEVNLSEKKPLILQHSAGEKNEATCVDNCEKCSSTLEMQVLEVQGFREEGESVRCLSEEIIEGTNTPDRTSNLNIFSSVKETSPVYIDVISRNVRESYKILEQNLSLIDVSTTSQVTSRDTTENLLRDAAGSYLCTVNVDTVMDYPSVVDPEKVVAVRSVNSVPVAGNHDTSIHGTTEISEDVGFDRVSASSLLRHTDVASADPEIKHPYTVLLNEAKCYPVKQKKESYTSQNQTAETHAKKRCFDLEKNSAIDATSTEHETRKKLLPPDGSSSFHIEGSSPHKRRKIENQLNSTLSASPSLKVGEDMQLNVNDSPVNDIDQNAVSDTRRGSESLSKLKFDKGKFSLQEGGVENVPCSFIETRLPSVLSLDKVAPEISQDLQMEEAAADPAGIVSDSRRQFSMEESQILVNAEDKLDEENADHFRCDSDSRRQCAIKENRILLNAEDKFEEENADHFTCNSDSRRQCAMEENRSSLKSEDKVEENVDHFTCDSDARRQWAMDDNQVLLNAEDRFEEENADHLICVEKSMQESKPHLAENAAYSTCFGVLQCAQSNDLISAKQPDFEGSILQSDNKRIGLIEQLCKDEEVGFDKLDLPKTMNEHTGLIEQLCKSACISTPLPSLPTMYKPHRTPNLYQSIPNGLLECMELKNFPVDYGDGKVLKVSRSCFGEDINHASQEKSFSDYLPFTDSQLDSDVKKVYTSPVSKFWDRIASSSCSSEKRCSLIPELPCISEENENVDEVTDAVQEGINSEVMTCSVKRQPLAEIKEDENVPPSVSEAEILNIRHSVDSVTTECFSRTRNRVQQKVGNHNSTKRRTRSKLKEKQNILGRANGVKRASESVRKLKVSGKSSLRKDGQSFLERETKVNNIVSNINSFIPLVQQKPAAITGKRDVKVKALEAAEAAKRLAEKKEHERKMKKEALKLERARLEQENLRQLELQRKKKEEERKKKENDMATRKRQREEEERLEKERKRKHNEEVRRQQREPEEKLRAKKHDKTMKCQALDDKVYETNVPNDEIGKHKKMENEMGSKFPEKLTETGDSTAEATSNVGKAVQNDYLMANTSQEQSYDISPYKASDEEEEEEEEEDDKPNKKFIPSWASSRSSLAIVVASQKVDPEVIFPPGSFCSIDEVMVSRKR